MERILNKMISERAKYEFKSYIEGILPDLCADEGGLEADLQSCRGAIRDFVGDSSCDTFPNVSDDDRKALIEEVVDFFCGGELVITAQDCPDCGGHLTLSTTCSECAYELGMQTGKEKEARQKLEEKAVLYKEGFVELDSICDYATVLRALLAHMEKRFANTEDAQEFEKVLELFEKFAEEATDLVTTLEIAKDDLTAELEE